MSHLTHVLNAPIDPGPLDHIDFAVIGCLHHWGICDVDDLKKVLGYITEHITESLAKLEQREIVTSEEVPYDAAQAAEKGKPARLGYLLAVE